MNRTALALVVGLLIGAAAGAAGGYLSGTTNSAGEGAGATGGAQQEELARLRKQVGVLERKLARKSATPLDAYRMDRRAGGGDAEGGGPTLDEAERDVSRLLQGLATAWHAPWILVDSAQETSRFFDRVASGPVIDGQRTGLSTRPPDGATIRFPAGRHALDAQSLSRYDPFPRELVIEGAGMDSTLLVMNDDIRPSGQVFNLRIRNATVNANGGRLLRASAEPFTLRLDKCRLVGFDGRVGGSLVSGERGAVFATDCRIEAGYGGRPAGSGSILNVSGPLLARFERCVVVGPFVETLSSTSSSAQVYVDCTFESMPPHMRPDDERYAGIVRLEECRFEFLEERAAPVTRSLSNVNDAW